MAKRRTWWGNPALRQAITLTEGVGGWWLSGSELDLDFANNRAFNRSTGFNGSPNGILTYTSPSPKLVYGDDGVLGYAPHNLFLNSGAPATQNVTLITGFSYTVTVTGSGSLAGSSGASGTASAGSPATFVATGTTGTFTLTGSLTTIQINLGSSALTYIPTTSAAVYSLPIDHDPITFDPLGVLIGEQRTNLLLRSQEFDNATWTKSRATVTANATTAPDGTTTADKLVPSVDVGTHRMYQSGITHGVLRTYAYTCYLKAGEYTFARLAITDSTEADAAICRFDLSTGTLDGTATAGGTFSAASASVEDVGDGWYRCTLIATCDATEATVAGWVASGNAVAGASSFAGDGTSGIYVWGAQLEAGAFPTSYIPTVASQVTRAADNISILTSAFGFNASEFTMLESMIFDAVSSSGYAYCTVIWDGSLSNTAAFTSNSGLAAVRVRSGGADQMNDYRASPPMQGTTLKRSLAVKANDCAVSYGGAAVITDTTVTMPVGVTTLRFAPYGSTHLKAFTYWPTRKTNAELQALAA